MCPFFRISRLYLSLHSGTPTSAVALCTVNVAERTLGAILAPVDTVLDGTEKVAERTLGVMVKVSDTVLVGRLNVADKTVAAMLAPVVTAPAGKENVADSTVDDTVTSVAVAAFISIAIPPNSETFDHDISTEVSLSFLNSEVNLCDVPPELSSLTFVNPVPAVAVSVATPFANAPNVALFALPNAARVTVNVDTGVPVALSKFVADCTIAPDPFVPDVSMPVNSSRVHTTCV